MPSQSHGKPGCCRIGDVARITPIFFIAIGPDLETIEVHILVPVYCSLHISKDISYVIESVYFTYLKIE